MPKGKRGERAWRDELVAHGYHARRGQQFSGSPDSRDVIGPDLLGVHFEVKAVEHLNFHETMAQAVNDAKEKIPVVAHKRNRAAWLVTLREQMTGLSWWKNRRKNRILAMPCPSDAGQREKGQMRF